MRNKNTRVQDFVYLVREGSSKSIVGIATDGPLMIMLEAGTEEVVGSVELTGKKEMIINSPVGISLTNSRAAATSSGGVIFTNPANGNVVNIEPSTTGDGLNTLNTLLSDLPNPRAVGISGSKLNEIGCEGSGKGSNLCDFDRLYYTDDRGLWVVDAIAEMETEDDLGEHKSDSGECKVDLSAVSAQRTLNDHAKLLFELKADEEKFNTLKVDRSGNLWLTKGIDGVLVLDGKSGGMLGGFTIEDNNVNVDLISIALGNEDGSVYVSTATKVFRAKVEKVGEIVVPFSTSATNIFSPDDNKEC